MLILINKIIHISNQFLNKKKPETQSSLWDSVSFLTDPIFRLELNHTQFMSNRRSLSTYQPLLL